MAKFDESKHPRDDDGKFTDGNGSKWTTSKRDYSNVQGGEAQPSGRSDKISMKDEVNTTTFTQAIKKAKASIDEEDAWRVSSPDSQEFDIEHPNARKFATKGGSTVAISQDGDIVGLCRNANDDISGSDLLKFAVENGGDRLDAFGKLWKFYAKNGFEPVSWTPFDEQYAPAGWKKGRDKTEPVIFWKYTGEKPKYSSYNEFIESVKASASYDEARDARNKEIKKWL